MKKTHELKIWPEFFHALIVGIRPFEIHIKNRGIAVGDTILLREWDTQRRVCTGFEETVRVVSSRSEPGDVVLEVELEREATGPDSGESACQASR